MSAHQIINKIEYVHFNVKVILNAKIHIHIYFN